MHDAIENFNVFAIASRASMIANDQAVLVLIQRRLAPSVMYFAILYAFRRTILQPPMSPVDVDAAGHLAVRIDVKALEYRWNGGMIRKCHHT